MDRQRLERELEDVFESTPTERRVVARQARDFYDSGRYRAVAGNDLGVEDILTNLADAPAGSSLVERWNWWLGSLELAHDADYGRFKIRRQRRE